MVQGGRDVKYRIHVNLPHNSKGMKETRKCSVCGEEKPLSKFTSKNICIACYHRERRVRKRNEKDISEEAEFRIKIVPNSMGDTFVVMPIEKYEELVRRANKKD